MNVSISVYYSIDNKVQEPVTVDIDDSWIEYLLIHYLKQNKGNLAELEDFIIQGVCLD